MRKQLARQAAAHSDHLADVLKVQEGELRKTFELDLEGRILDEREGMRSEIVLWIARMEGIEHALESESSCVFPHSSLFKAVRPASSWTTALPQLLSFSTSP